MNNNDSIATLFRHERRPQWGLAIMAWEGRDKRRYQFQDGRLRTFKRGWYHLFNPVDRPVPEAERIADELQSKLDMARARRETLAEAKEKGQSLTTFSDQLLVFDHVYPNGFEDARYQTELRGQDAPRVLKRHRDQAIAVARDELAPDKLAGWIEASELDAIKQAAVKALAATNLVKPSERKVVEALEGDALQAFSSALHELLCRSDDDGGSAIAEPVDRLIAALASTGERVTWPLATGLLAVARPDDHICVRPSVFRTQAKWMAPTLKFDLKPSGRLYERLRSMSFLVRRRLEQADHGPRDLMDVYEFIWATLRPAAKRTLEDLKSQRRAAR